MSRVRVYEAQGIAAEMRRRFYGKPHSKRISCPWDWPRTMRCVGKSLAVAYASDKWDEPQFEEYKHLAESENYCFCVPGLVRYEARPSEPVEVMGPLIDIASIPMPDSFAHLDMFLFVDLQLYIDGTDRQPRLGKGDQGIMEITLRHGYLGGSKFRWSRVSDRPDQPFLFVYTKREGPLMMIVGKELDVEKDGIVG